MLVVGRCQDIAYYIKLTTDGLVYSRFQNSKFRNTEKSILSPND